MNDDRALVPSIALAAYAEALAEGRRVLVFGDSSSRLAEQVLERGARLIHVYDPEPARVAEAATRNTSRNVTFAALGEGGLALREGAFDLAIVDNLAQIGNIASALTWLKRALSPRGAALIACPNPDVSVRLLAGSANRADAVAIDYYSLYDAVAAEFQQVRMLGQTPFVGYAVVDFAPDADPAPALDTGFLPGGAEEPEWFIALASHQPVELDEFSIIQLPARSVLQRRGSAGSDEAVRSARSSERRLRQKVAALEAETRRLSHQLLEHKRTSGSSDTQELAQLRKELAQRDQWIQSLEARASTADERADQVQAELEEQVEQSKLREQAQIGEATKLRDQRIRELEEKLQQRQAENGGLRSELRSLEQKLSQQTQASAEAAAAELTGLEQQLVERAHQVRQLERELRETERVGRELLLELEEMRQSRESTAVDESGTHEQAGSPSGEMPPDVAAAPVEFGGSANVKELYEKLDRLAALNAEREADLTALRWTVAELESKLALGLPAQVQLRLAERDQLAQQLEQAKALLEQQSVLLAQLRAERSRTSADAS